MFGFFKRYQRELCPYCFEYFRLGDTPFRCTSPPQRCAPQLDPVVERLWRESRPIGKVLEASGRFVKKLRCGDCNGLSRKRLCPHCHSILPYATGQCKNYVFSIIGAKESGKSHYLAVLIEQLKKEIGPKFNMLLEPLPDTITRYRQDFYDPVYKAGRTIQATRSALADAAVQRPLLFSLTISGKGFFGGEVIKKSIILAFFDTAGEDLNDSDVMSTVNKYIIWSDGIILLIDPLQLPQIREQLGPTTALPGINTEAEDILNRTHHLIARGRELDPDDKVPVPIAVSFSKFDAVEPLVSHIYPLNANPQHLGGFDELDFTRSNAEMTRLLETEWGGAYLSQQVKTHFSRFGFFGVSALGCNPHATNRIPTVRPKRVEDPFLWLLRESSLIGTARSA